MKSLNLPWLIVTVFIISWLGVIPGLLIAHGVEIPAALTYLEILMTLGPILGALIFITLCLLLIVLAVGLVIHQQIRKKPD